MAKTGRKPVQDKKLPVTVYFKKSEIKLIGGKEKCRLVCLKALENEVLVKTIVKQ